MKFAVKLTAGRIRAAREMLELDPFAFAAALGVHTSTVYRWESATKPNAVDMLQGEMISALVVWLRKATAKERSGAGVAIRAGLINKGTLGGVLALLRVVVP